MLTALGYDPATQTQRLGDGFYEQRLVREQVAQLTGRRFLGSFTDDEAQYRALLDAGQAFASAYQLKPGIALTREQMALLTSDIVWLVERSVTLPDGRTQRVLVPQLYALVDPDTPTLSQGLISAKGAKIDLTDGLFNAGTLAARENLSINAASITNILGQLQGNNVDLRASGSITSILGQIAARQNLSMNAGENMVFMGGGIRAGGNASLSAGGDLLLLAYDTGKQVRVIPRDKDNNPNNDKGPTWAYENSTYNQTGVDINVGGSFSGSAGGNLVAQGVTANVGGSTNLSAGKDMQLTTALHGHVQTLDFFNRYKTAGSLIKIEQNIHQSNADLTNSANSWSSGGGLNLSAGGSIDIVGAQINSQGYSYSTGGNYSERAAYDIHERVSTSSTKMSGPGTYLLDFTNNMNWLATGGQAGGRTETYRGTNDVDSTRTAIVTNINAGSGEVKHNVAGETFIEGSIVKGGLISPERVGPRVTLAAAVDTRHVEHSVSTSTIRWQSTDSTGYIQQTLHMPEIHGTIPAGMSAYQGAGGVSVQLPAGSNVRAAIEQLSQQPGKEYLKELGNRSDIDWQRVEVLNKSLDFSKSGLTKEATLAVIIAVSILTYGYASGWGASAAAGAEMTATAGAAGAVTTTTAAGATVTLSATGAAVASAVSAGITSLASTAAVSLINNQGDIGATLKELGSKENAQGLLLTMATAGLSNAVLTQAGLANVNAQSKIEQLFAKQALQGLTSAVLESAVLGTNLEDAIKNNLKSALINTVAAKGAFTIGEGGKTGDLNAASKVIAHALLGCAIGAPNAGNGSGCAPGAAGGAIGEIVAGLYADASGYDDLKSRANAPGADPALKQQLAVVTNTMTELAKLSGAGAALLIGGDASSAQIAMGTAANVAINNRQLHIDERALAQRLAVRSGGRYTVTQIENALRNSGNSALGETVATGMVVNTSKPDGVYDTGATFNAGSPGTYTAVQTLPNGGQVDAALASFIQANTGGANSPYAWSSGQLGQSSTGSSAQTNSGTGAHYETRVVDGRAYSVPVVDCPAASCANTDNVARYGLNSQDQAAVAAYDAAVERQTAKGVGSILIGGVAVAATPVTLVGAIGSGAVVGGTESVKNQVIDTGSISATQTGYDTAVGALVGVAVAGGAYVAGRLIGWVNGKPLVGFAGGQTALVHDANSVKFGSADNGIYTDTKPMGTQFPNLIGVNPHYIENAGPGINTNCVSCVNASQARLTGTNPTAVASPSSGYANANALLPSAPFGVQPETSVASVVQQMTAEGNGAVGVVLIKQPGGPSHVINVVNKGGQVYFVDTQMGKIVTLRPNLVVQLGLP